MIAMPPIIDQIARDRALNGRDMQVWVICVSLLHFIDFRALPLSRIVHEYNTTRPPVRADASYDTSFDSVSRSSICRSLHRLVAEGYLERAEVRAAHNAGLYRLPLARVYPRRAS